MKSQSIKKLYNLHSWVGIVTGILLFVVAFTGALSVFGRPELTIWGNPQVRGDINLDMPRLEKLVAEYAEQVPQAYKEEVLIFFPRSTAFTYINVLFEAHSGAPTEQQDGENAEQQHAPAVGKLFEFHPITYELVSAREGEIGELFEGRRTDMADFIVDFHADLHLGRPIGLLLTGILGLTLMASIVTGIIIHRKILAQLFTFRPHKSFSLLLNDGHKVLGVWGTLFHSMIAFTGAFLGLAVVVLVPAAAFVSFKGDQDKLIEVFTALDEPQIQSIYKPTQISKIYQDAANLHDEAKVYSMTILGYNDASAIAYVSVAGGDEVAAQTAVYNGADASFVKRYSNFGRIDGFSGVIFDMMFPLHFGNFGGVFVKALWTVLGLTTAMLPITGLMLWLERGVKSASPRYSLQTYQRFHRLIVGSCGGIVVACFALFPAQLILTQMLQVNNPGSIFGWIFFPAWIACILWAMCRKDAQQSTRQISVLVAAVLLSIMPLNAILTNSHLLNVWQTGHYISVAVDLVTFVLGLGTLWLVRKFSANPAPALDLSAAQKGV